ncbi:MAG: hypothetical protein EHM43_04625 [Ignavibacteriae bacterium]|nr:MAG: hypothetical protein EHM43_04625 [Ignavibacteriota bacterium]
MHLHLSISIVATPERVWEAVTTDAPYREWTAAFNPTSFFEGGWQTGDKIRFIGTDEERVLRHVRGYLAKGAGDPEGCLRTAGLVLHDLLGACRAS